MNLRLVPLVLTSSLLPVVSSPAEDSRSHAAPPPFEDSAEKKDQRMRWFRDARFGMFIHWGLYSQLGGEWKDQHVMGGAEWIQKYLAIPSSQYAPLAKSFDGRSFDADAWIKMIAAAGVKYICVTTKHHDGFCIWPTKLNDDWNIAVTPFGRDPLKELAEACERHGVVFCIYHSILDWHHPHWPGRPPFNDHATGKPDKETFRKYLYGQLNELFTNYGPIGMIWLDGSWDRQHWTSEDGRQLEDFIRTLQPSVVINNRSGYLPPQPKLEVHIENEYSYVFAGDYISPEGEVPSTGLPGIDWETCQTMQLPNNWGYNRLVGFRTYVDLQRQLVDVASKGGNLLLNIGPTGPGAITPQALECLDRFSTWMAVNGEAIHGSTASPFATLPFDGRCTRKGNRLFFHVFEWPADRKLVVPAVNPVKHAALLAVPETLLRTRTTPRGTILKLPATAPDPVVSVIAVELEGELQPLPAPEQVARGLAAEVSSVWPGREAELSPQHITDGDFSTLWAATEPAREATVTLTLHEAREISEILLSDAPYGRITRFEVDARFDGSWKTIHAGNTIGRALAIPAAGQPTDAVRLRILGAADTPTLAEFQLLALPR
ncbi:MAG: alpha-L-fucosidase [Verrucomicrobiae bacterium]|nr:alpha-L-fucosidase [Verrucomicrobiae bacterium]